LDYQQQRYFETAFIVGKLVSEEPGGPDWAAAEKRFWMLYWSELSMVEHRIVEAAMVEFGKKLELLKADLANKSHQLESHKLALKNEAYKLSHSIRAAIESTWGTAGIIEQALVTQQTRAT
jgi:hypothetical protein